MRRREAIEALNARGAAFRRFRIVDALPTGRKKGEKAGSSGGWLGAAFLASHGWMDVAAVALRGRAER